MQEHPPLRNPHFSFFRQKFWLSFGPFRLRAKLRAAGQTCRKPRDVIAHSLFLHYVVQAFLVDAPLLGSIDCGAPRPLQYPENARRYLDNGSHKLTGVPPRPGCTIRFTTSLFWQCKLMATIPLHSLWLLLH